MEVALEVACPPSCRSVSPTGEHQIKVVRPKKMFYNAEPLSLVSWFLLPLKPARSQQVSQ